jgi:oxalate decarboxylase/phosphoglucose isomerase-like protein (cupin superfamily)
MRKISLKKNSGLNLVYEKDEILFEKAKFLKNSVVTLDDMRAQILNEELQSPESFYTKYSNVDVEGVFKSKKIKINLIDIPSNVAGIEYVKTRGVQCSTHNKVLEIVHGGGIILMQKFAARHDESEVVLLKIRPTQKIIIPARYAYILINNRSTPLIALEFMSSKAVNRMVLDEMRGMAYYVIRKNAKQEIVRNPLYKILNTKKKVDWPKFYKQCNITPKTPFSRQVLRKYEKFNWLLNPAKDSDIAFDF